MPDGTARGMKNPPISEPSFFTKTCGKSGTGETPPPCDVQKQPARVLPGTVISLFTQPQTIRTTLPDRYKNEAKFYRAQNPNKPFAKMLFM